MSANRNHLRHLAIIPDGNRRWSKKHGVDLGRTYFDSCAKMFEICRFLEAGKDLQELSLFFVSVDNLRSRPHRELDPLFAAGHHFLDLFNSSSLFESIELRWIGLGQHDFVVCSKLYEGFVSRVEGLGKRAKGRRRANVLIGYDVRRDIEVAMSRDTVFKYENLAVSSPVDLIVRSGGYQRLSGFLPLMCQYAEFEFIDKLFPDVTLDDITACMGRFNDRVRKFGS